jgi:hypothetical protein
MIELLVNDSCQQVNIAKMEIEAALRELRINEPVQIVRVRSYAEARKLRFEGSPEVQIDGQDIDPQGHLNFKHDACRTYFWGGKFWAFPPKEMVKQAIIEIRGKK